jgi:hypothetical protein
MFIFKKCSNLKLFRFWKILKLKKYYIILKRKNSKKEYEKEKKTQKVLDRPNITPRMWGYSVCGHQVVCHRLTGAFLRCNHQAVPQVHEVNH